MTTQEFLERLRQLSQDDRCAILDQLVAYVAPVDMRTLSLATLALCAWGGEFGGADEAFNDLKSHVVTDRFSIRTHPRKGRCVIANVPFRAGEAVDTSPVILLETGDVKEESALNDYPMHWSDTHDCLCLGIANLFNHSSNPNVQVQPIEDQLVFRTVAVRDINPGDELTKKYACALWFEECEEPET